MLSARTEFELADYVYDNALRIWRRESTEAFAYSDGDAVEEALATILREATDLSMLSPELARQCTDWPRRYHLNAARANLLRPLAHNLTGDILEIGAGCGAITRFLGENGANVLALEGSQRRASIAALRTRDLPNVTVLNDRFDRFVPQRLFDVVTLIGVLEYAALFSAAADPVGSMLEAVSAMLKPDGILIIAIENQLGLKYLAGAPEDHLGIRMFGVQDLYQKPGVETFGRADLERRLVSAGYKSIELALPFPDYKLPSSVVLPASFSSHRGFNPDVLASQTVTRDVQVNSTVLTFALERVWRTVGRNGLLPDLSNSFLFVASNADSLPTRFVAGELACHYSAERQPAFCKVTRFVEKEDGLHVTRDPLSEAKAPLDAEFGHDAVHESMIHGNALDEDFGRLVATPGWAINQVADIAHRYVEALFFIAADKVERPHVFTPDVLFPGDMLDIVPQNIVIGADGVPQAVDREWFAHAPLPVGYLLFRALTLMIRGVSTCALPVDLRWLNRRTFFAETFAHLGLCLTPALIDDYLHREARFMSFALGREVAAIDVDVWINSQMPSELDMHAAITDGLSARNRQIEDDLIEVRGDLDRTRTQSDELSNRIAALQSQYDILKAECETLQGQRNELELRREALSVELSTSLDIQNSVRTELHAVEASREAIQRELQSVLDSTVWRATGPLRSALSLVKNKAR